MKVRYDPDSDILYIVVREGPVEDTITVDDDIYIELDEEGKIIGIEIWRASRNIIENIIQQISKKLNARARTAQG